jgi:hypothetical protein
VNDVGTLPDSNGGFDRRRPAIDRFKELNPEDAPRQRSVAHFFAMEVTCNS